MPDPNKKHEKIRTEVADARKELKTDHYNMGIAKFLKLIDDF